MSLTLEGVIGDTGKSRKSKNLHEVPKSLQLLFPPWSTIGKPPERAPMAKLNVSRTLTLPHFAATKLHKALFRAVTKLNQILVQINVLCHYLPSGRCPLLHPVHQAKQQGSAIRVQIATTKDQAQGQLDAGTAQKGSGKSPIA